MDAYNIEVSFEDLVCRLPALFAYLEWNDDGTVETHVATDSVNGCYGKVVDNIHIPANVRLTNYVMVQEQEIPIAYLWNSDNTILLREDENEVFSVSGSLFLRKVLWYGYEKTDRGFLDGTIVDEIPIYVDDDSPEKIKLKQKGKDGKLIECSDEIYDYYVKTARYNYFERKDIISPCTTYSYRTIIYEYYKYKDVVGKNNSFIKFVEVGIGLIDVDKELLKLTNEELYSEVPDEIYLSQIRTILAEYKKYQTACKFYKNHYLANGLTNKTLSEKCKKYERMGGDSMTNWLIQMLQKSYDIANEYKCHADNKDFSVSLNLNVMLNKTTDIIGLESVDLNEFVPGKRYYDGDFLSYEGKTYVCLLNRIDTHNISSNYSYILKSIIENDSVIKGLFVFNGSDYIHISNDNISFIPDTDIVPSIKITDYIFYKDWYYVWKEDEGYELIDVVSYSCGIWDEESERYVFDDLHFVPLTEIATYDKWYDDTNPYGENYRFFETLNYIPSIHLYDYISVNENVYEWDENVNSYIPIIGDEYSIKETTNSKLRDLRSFTNYVNPFGNSEEPDLNQDWLYYYKVNEVTGLVVDTDEYGNIISDTDDFSSGSVANYLHAYGNIITAITYNSTDNTITFDYVVGGHLTAICGNSSTDIDGNKIYYYNGFSYDSSSGDGVHFSETYSCIGTDIADLGSDFTKYINGDKYTLLKYAFKKFPFRTIPVLTPDGIKNIQGVGTASIPSRTDLLNNRVIREEWMSGLYFRPKLKSNVSIDRGNGASFERHLRLGEINTMEDFENYQNGGYFKISES